MLAAWKGVAFTTRAAAEGLAADSSLAQWDALWCQGTGHGLCGRRWKEAPTGEQESKYPQERMWMLAWNGVCSLPALELEQVMVASRQTPTSYSLC